MSLAFLERILKVQHSRNQIDESDDQR